MCTPPCCFRVWIPATLNRLGMYLTCDPVYEEEDRKYHKQ